MASTNGDDRRRARVFLDGMHRRRLTDCKEGLYDGWLVDEVYSLVSERPGHFGCKMRCVCMTSMYICMYMYMCICM